MLDQSWSGLRHGARAADEARSRGRHSVHLDLQPETQERADEDDDAKHEHVVERRRDRDRPDQIACNQNLESEQDRAAEGLPHDPVGEATVLTASVVAKRYP